MQKNEIKAEMDIVKMAVQALIASLFAALFLAIQGRVIAVLAYLLYIFAGVAAMVFLIRKYKYLGRQLDVVEGEKSA